MHLRTSTLMVLLLATSLVFAQSSPKVDSIASIALDEVMVTATRGERQLSSLPLPAQIIGKEEIEQINAMRLSELLNEQTGLITIPDFGGGEGIQLQGLDSEYTLIMIDGVPLVGRSAGTLDLSRIAVGNVSQIEIVKGASSSLYGSEALGGVINIITEKPKTGIGGNVSYRFGRFNTHDFNTNLNYKKGKLGVNAFINRNSSAGYDLVEEDALNTVEPFENYTFNTQLTYDVSEHSSLLVSARFFTQTQDYVASETLRGESQLNEWNTLLKWEVKTGEKINTTLELYATNYQANEFLNEADGTLFSQNDFDQWFIRPEVRSTFSLTKQHTLVGGIGITRESLARTDFLGSPVFNAPYAYVQYDGQFTEKLNVILGARYDAHSAYQSQLSPKAALRYAFSPKLVLKASAGYGYKAPDFRQLYFNFSNSTVGYTVLGYNAVQTRLPQLEAEGELASVIQSPSNFSEPLRPESSFSLNIGTDWNVSQRLKLSLNYFRNDIENLIDTRVVARKTNGQNVFSYFNVDEVRTQGVEANAQFFPVKNVSVSMGYQLLFAEDQSVQSQFAEGNIFIRQSSGTLRLNESHYFGLFNRSRHMGNTKLLYELPKLRFDASLRVTYRSRYGLFDTNGNTYLDAYDDFVAGYTIWDVAFNKDFSDAIRLGTGIDNFLNFRDVENISNLPGRLFFITLNVQF